ncbi:glycosyltransferase [Microvirga sp. W0021]|uniref:Glycosyltransferase n=1 Tax=Hohaiivirga grylli TaxID=3133970 RepID=A0ABV0BGC0_9HYPH
MRILLYSHDTFGLGHLRRSRAIANALVQRWPDSSILIISGSPIIGNFEFMQGVDYIRIPGVTKLTNGNYRSLHLNTSLEDAVQLRQSLILETVQSFEPDIMIIDKEPTGFHGEVIPALKQARMQGCRLVLGIRDILDEPALLIPEWERKGAVKALVEYYDEIWVYGLKDIYEPLAALNLPEDVQKRVYYTGYLNRDMPEIRIPRNYPRIVKQPFTLVTTGGGGDGADLIDWVISAYEAKPDLNLSTLLVFGPFINRSLQKTFLERIAKFPRLDAILFDNKLEVLMQRAEAVVAMGGYNTFCEILSFDKKALIIPRTKPRLEQHIRAVASERLGLVRHLNDDGIRDPHIMVEALERLSTQGKPSEATIPGLLDGLARIEERVSSLLPQLKRESAQDAAE